MAREDLGVNKSTLLVLLELRDGGDLVPQVNRLLALGRTMKEIGEAWRISQPTLRKYLREAGTEGRLQWLTTEGHDA